MADALKQAGKLAEFKQLDGCDHDLSTETCRLAAAEGITDFLAKYNPVN
ncbi:MAG: hypothetical protein JF615_03605 [Asticcacaulis sp.]|nr:hypothetical protein [Asticcacaulis sp.]